MSLTGSEAVLEAALSPEIESQLRAVFQVENITFSNEVITKFSKAIANAVALKIIPHITANAVTKTSVVNIQTGNTTLANQLGVIT